MASTNPSKTNDLEPRLGAKEETEPLPAPAAKKLALFRRMMAKGKVSGSVKLEINFNAGREASWKVACDIFGRPDGKPQELDEAMVRRALIPGG